jgi:hypothetical protein
MQKNCVQLLEVSFVVTYERQVVCGQFMDYNSLLSRAQKRMDGEDVFGRKITVTYPSRVLERDKKEGSPLKTQSGKEYCI